MACIVGEDMVDLSLDANDAFVARANRYSLGYAQPHAHSAEASRFCGWIGRGCAGRDGVCISMPRDFYCLRCDLVFTGNRTDRMGWPVVRA